VGQVEMTVDTGQLPLGEQRVRSTAALARRMNGSGDMAAAAGHAVIAAHLVANIVGKLDPPLFPHRWISEIVGLFRDDVANTTGDVGIGFNKPIRFRDVAIAAAWLDAGCVAAVNRFGKERIGCQVSHAVTGSTKSVAGCGAIDFHRCDGCGSAKQSAQRDQRNDCEPPLQHHRHAFS